MSCGAGAVKVTQWGSVSPWGNDVRGLPGCWLVMVNGWLMMVSNGPCYLGEMMMVMIIVSSGGTMRSVMNLMWSLFGANDWLIMINDS